VPAVAAALLVGSADVRAARNYRGADEGALLGRVGISEALQIITGPGAEG
jgi:hypothetical protein